MIRIHGKYYDLERLRLGHPGGNLKLFDTLSESVDCTALFEFSHSMKNIEYVKSLLNDYEINIPMNEKYQDKTYNFERYHELSKNVKKMLAGYYKADYFWHFKMLLLTITYMITYTYGILYENKYDYILSFIAGQFYIYIGFCMMHDASHYAISKNHSMNEILSVLWNEWALWDTYIWYVHHVVYHHSFTGEFGKDPDMVHLNPIIRKDLKDKKTINFFGRIQEKIVIPVLLFLPGMYSGQVLAYFSAIFKKRLWKVNLSGYKVNYFYKFITLLSFYNLVTCHSYLCVMSYIFALNLFYAISIIPDHDMFESTVLNDKETPYWEEQQIRKSGNFLEKSTLFTELHGGINYQIIHHLFPTVSHRHYRRIEQLVKEHCIKYDIPYVSKDTFYEILMSYLKMIKYMKCD